MAVTLKAKDKQLTPEQQAALEADQRRVAAQTAINKRVDEQNRLKYNGAVEVANRTPAGELDSLEARIKTLNSTVNNIRKVIAQDPAQRAFSGSAIMGGMSSMSRNDQMYTEDEKGLATAAADLEKTTKQRDALKAQLNPDYVKPEVAPAAEAELFGKRKSSRGQLEASARSGRQTTIMSAK